MGWIVDEGRERIDSNVILFLELWFKSQVKFTPDFSCGFLVKSLIIGNNSQCAALWF